MRQKISAFLLFLMMASLLAACGSTATTVPAATTAAAPAATTAPASAGTTAPASAATTAAPAATTAPANAPTTAAAISTVRPTLAAQGSNATGTQLTEQAAIPALPADAKKGGTLTIASSGGLAIDLHPYVSTAAITTQWGIIWFLIWEGSNLLNYNYTTLQWELAMAKDMKVDPTGKEFTFTLKPDLKWSDGSPITVADFQFAYDNFSKVNKENPTANYAGLADKLQVASFKTDDAAGTITVTTIKPFARDLALGFVNTAPMPKKVWEGKPFYDASANPEIKKPSVVSGAYMIDSYDPTSQGVFKPNPYWYRGKPNFEQVIVKPFAPNVIGEALKNGQADIAGASLPPSLYDDLKKSENLSLYEWYGLQNNFRYIVYNTTAAPFNDKALRQAIAYALDRKAMITLAENGHAIPQYTYQTDSSPFYTPQVSQWEFNMDKSKKLLADSGYKLEGGTLTGKDGKPLKFTGLYATTDTAGKLVLTYIQQQLKQIGIDVTVEAKDPNSYLAAILTKKYDAAVGLAGAANFPDPDSFKTYYIKDGTYNVAGYVVPRLDELFGQGAIELDNNKRKEIYQETMRILTEDLPSQVFYAVIYYVTANKKLGGITANKSSSLLTNNAIATWYWKA